MYEELPAPWTLNMRDRAASVAALLPDFLSGQAPRVIAGLLWLITDEQLDAAAKLASTEDERDGVALMRKWVMEARGLWRRTQERARAVSGN